MLCVTQDNLVKMLTAECQLERFLLENPPNEKNVDKAAVELASIQHELLKVAGTHAKVCYYSYMTPSPPADNI